MKNIFLFVITWLQEGFFVDMEWDVKKLTANQKRIADFIEKMGKQILYYSETELAETLEISNATVSRFWKQIGYDNFKSFKAALKEKEQISPDNKLKNSLLQIQDQELQIHEHLLSITKSQLVNTLQEIDYEKFNKAIRLMSICRKIYIHAPSSSEGLSILMKHRLARFGLEIELLPKSGHELFESLMHIRKEDVVFIFGFVAMNREASVLLDYAKRVNYKTIILTDLLISDFQENGDYIFYTNRGELWEFHSMIAPTFLVENFILGIGQYLEKQSLENLEKLSELRKLYKEQLPKLK
ncbi:MurR/RpiR family transcriptional regulator [Robertmurraya kyonggiensis]|uniref:MurR/RpiR family transcriptional regulator n=2 Tax=Robertmurraya kyonggiensis TaxID=1037680 RepID=A0A4U1D1K2_9BACI|nr:MurR/RpiR family transcriptional regulator [Robertmurraya kyonggiensis]